jgi:hypothetical protein
LPQELGGSGGIHLAAYLIARRDRLEVDYAAMDITMFRRFSLQQPLPGVAGAG